MYPPLFALVSADSQVRAQFGLNPTRIFLFGEAPETVAKPYAVWQTISGSPENYISNTPDMDSFSVQVDVYATTATSVRAAAQALRNAIEPRAHISAWRGESRDPETNLFRYSFDVEFLTAR